MRITFTTRDNGPQNLLADCEILLEDEDMAGLRITGLALWSGKDGGVFVTLPSKKVGEKYHDYIRGLIDIAPVKALKARIVEAYHDWGGNEREPEPDDEVNF